MKILTMNENTLHIKYDEYETEKELSPEYLSLLTKAREAARDAYAPYSKFHVGAALKLENGTIITGNNQENAAFPSGLCAERVAVFSAAANHPGQAVELIAITAKTENFELNHPVSPCGACRQVLAEYEILHKKPMTIILGGETGKIVVLKGIGNLLPLIFDGSDLKK